MKRSSVLVAAIALYMVNCHGPNSRVSTALNTRAGLTGDIPLDPLGWRVLTSALNPQDATMSTLFANESASEYAHTQGGSEYPPGAMLALVAWDKQEDARWFGANIPAQPRAVEFVSAVRAPDGRTTYIYRHYEGFPLRERSIAGIRTSERIAWLLSQRAAVMP